MASLTWWTWVWVNSGSWWWTGRPGVLRFMGSQRVGHDWATEVNWTESHFFFGTHVSPSYSETYWKVFSFQVTGRSHLCSKTGIWNRVCCSTGLLTKDSVSWQSWEPHSPNKPDLNLVIMLSFWSPLFNVSYTMFPSSHFINDSFIYSSIRCLLSNYSMPCAVPYVEDSVVSKTHSPWITHLSVSCIQAVLGCLILLL